ncbi:MAG: epoxyqueuosine reductase QueH [Lachnospiraceae bacterium]|nr:epoxyqueuosine reductase QueH [Lachnospiraceae bacterium]
MADRKNYQRVLESTLSEIEQEGRVPSLLLHSCCGPCSSYVLEYLSRYFHITVLYYNPNIYPPEEYRMRAGEQERFIRAFNDKALHPIRFEEGAYDRERFYEMARGLEEEPERGARCHRCYRLRLEETAREASERGFDYITTTLSISPHKDAAVLNEIGREVAGQYHIRYLYSDFKKKNGYLRSTELAAEYGMYRQDYCGCEFSFRARQGMEKE